MEKDGIPEVRYGTGGIHNPEPLCLLMGKQQISFPDPPMKGKLLRFETVFLRPLGKEGDTFPGPTQALLHRQVQKDGQVRLPPPGREGIEKSDGFHIQSPGVALIHQGRIGETIAKDHLPCRQRRQNHLADVLRPGGGKHKQLRFRTNRVGTTVEK